MGAASAAVPSLELWSQDARYPLASLEHSSGFVAAPPGVALADAPAIPPEGRAFGLAPDFRQHPRYWLYTRVVNRSEQRDWVLHVSNFGFRQPGVLLLDEDGGRRRLGFERTGPGGDAHINVLGRAVELTLAPGQARSLVVELSATHPTWHPYVAVMSAPEYQSWSTGLNIAFLVAVGVIVGLAALAVVCGALNGERAFFWGALSSLLMLAYYLEHSSLPALLWRSDYHKGGLFWLLVSSALLSQLAFAASFLRVARGGGWYRAFLGAGLLTLVVGALALTVPFEARVSLYVFNYVILAVVILGSGIARVRAEGRYYVIYLLGWFPLVLSLLQVAVVIQGSSAPARVITESYKMVIVLYIQILHMFLHAMALILRVRALREEKLRAEFLSRSKSRFIAQSSHDLSQPLHAMGLFLGHLRPYVRDAEGRGIFLRLKAAHRRMSGSFQSIMDLGKLEAGAIRPVSRAVPLAPLLRRLADEYRPLAEDKGLRLRLRARAVTVQSDPELLERMLRNLIGNAIKYTDTGGVLVGVRQRRGRVVIQVWDSGRGIGGDARERVFDIYQRSDQGGGEEGAGIGLSIVKHLAELLDHPLSLVSAPGRGSCFAVALAPASAPPARQPGPDHGAPRVLLVMVPGPARDTLAARMERWGCRVTTALSLTCARTALAEGAPAALVLCEPACLDGSVSLPGDPLAVCLGEPEGGVPPGWLLLDAAAPPSRLRALLNAALRRADPPPTAGEPAMGAADDG
ncbi:sensor histidine kinase [Alloalcanivorax marinus]|uniref:sensor histidine kinase n=1 Tax=Alloalcanivorax marinus TaxID=1177169 RepID=UPI001932A8CF|nr:sensor histidine kinase [Alloalcanivorax marinus]MBL7249441.1 sensor histidine kinase [Alloalcanivorax marinus]